MLSHEENIQPTPVGNSGTSKEKQLRKQALHYVYIGNIDGEVRIHYALNAEN